jgi:hypothetical protein
VLALTQLRQAYRHGKSLSIRLAASTKKARIAPSPRLEMQPEWSTSTGPSYDGFCPGNDIASAWRLWTSVVMFIRLPLDALPQIPENTNGEQKLQTTS